MKQYIYHGDIHSLLLSDVLGIYSKYQGSFLPIIAPPYVSDNGQHYPVSMTLCSRPDSDEHSFLTVKCRMHIQVIG